MIFGDIRVIIEGFKDEIILGKVVNFSIFLEIFNIYLCIIGCKKFCYKDINLILFNLIFLKCIDYESFFNIVIRRYENKRIRVFIEEF